MSGRTLESVIASSSSACSFFMISGRRLSSQKRYVIVVEVVSVPAILEKWMHNWDSASPSTEPNSQVANTFRDDIVIRHWLWRRVLVLQESFQHRNFLSFACLAGIHLGTHLVYASTDELDSKIHELAKEIKYKRSPRPKFCQSHTSASNDC